MSLLIVTAAWTRREREVVVERRIGMERGGGRGRRLPDTRHRKGTIGSVIEIAMGRERGKGSIGHKVRATIGSRKDVTDSVNVARNMAQIVHAACISVCIQN
jgi:hypothetical protein